MFEPLGTFLPTAEHVQVLVTMPLPLRKGMSGLVPWAVIVQVCEMAFAVAFGVFLPTAAHVLTFVVVALPLGTRLPTLTGVSV